MSDFKFNEAGCCENPETVHVYSDKIFQCTILLTEKGGHWYYGYKLRGDDSILGGSGACAGTSSGRQKYPDRDHALVNALGHAKSFFTVTHPNAKHQKTCDHILRLINILWPVQYADMPAQTEKIWIMNYGGHILYKQATVFPDMMTIIVHKEGQQQSFNYKLSEPAAYTKALGLAMDFINKQNTPAIMAKTETTVAAPFTAPTTGFVKISDISPDPNQPRKHFHPVDDRELMDSIRSQGILQSLLLRPVSSSEALKKDKAIKTKYLVVCGERRFRAAMAVLQADPAWMAGMVPAQIRDMDDNAAMEAQIVENLQRKDVHPMEEALAFIHLSKRGLSQEEIGARVGKGDRFVRARLVLAQLCEPWIGIFMRNAIDLDTALNLCRFPAAIQTDIFKEGGFTKKDLERQDLKISITNFAQYKGDLAEACFNTDDKTIIPEMGACTGCPFNSNTSILFPDENTKPRCLNLKCYQKKTDHGYKVEMQKVTEDPANAPLLLKLGYRSEDDKEVIKLKAKGLKVLAYGDYNLAEEPVPPGDYQQWKEAPTSDYDDDDSDKENRKTWADDMARYQRDRDEFARDQKSGKIKRALVVQGDNSTPRGRVIFVYQVFSHRVTQTTSSQPGKTPAQLIKDGAAKAVDYKEEIKRLEEANEKVAVKEQDTAHLELVSAFKGNPIAYKVTDKPMNKAEKAALIFLLLDKMGGVEDLWSDYIHETEQDVNFSQAMGIDIQILGTAKTKSALKGASLDVKVKGPLADLDPSEPEDFPKVWKYLESLTDGQLALVFRRVLTHDYGNKQHTPGDNFSTKAHIMRKVIEGWAGYEGLDIKAIDKAGTDRAKEKIARNNAKIADYKEKMKPPKPAPKAKAAPAVKEKKYPVETLLDRPLTTREKKEINKHGVTPVADPLKKRTIAGTKGGGPLSKETVDKMKAVTGVPDLQKAAEKYFELDTANETEKPAIIAKIAGMVPVTPYTKEVKKMMTAKTLDDSTLSSIIETPQFIEIMIAAYKSQGGLQSDKDVSKLLTTLQGATTGGFENIFPFAEEAFKKAGITRIDDFAKIADLTNSFPKSQYGDWFFKGLAGNWPSSSAFPSPNKANGKKVPAADAALIILRSAEFLALLRITQKGLYPAELKAIDHQFPELAAATDPGKCKEIADKLIAYWTKQAAKSKKAK